MADLQPGGLPAAAPPQWTVVKYGTEHALQDMMLWTAPPRPSSSKNIWLIFIHGGGWRAPVQTREDILPAAKLLTNSPQYSSPMAHVAGIASLNYGLSAPASQANLTAGRGYVHPRHLHDAQAGLRALSALHGVGRPGGPDYVLAGHSCGATMALQLAMGLDADLPRGAGMAVPPLAVVGVEGLYDLSASPYPEMFAMAFGPDPKEWARVSPTKYAKLLEAKGGKWLKRLVLGHSRGDTLVDWQQPTDMLEAARLGVESGELVELVGDHDEVWDQGRELARLLAHAVDVVVADQKAA
jgi:acetyl esterase/lipase